MPLKKDRGAEQRTLRAAIASKLVESTTVIKETKPDGTVKTIAPDMSYLLGLTTDIATRVNDLDTIYKLMPDIELAIQIWISSVLSPTDLSTPELQFMTNTSFKHTELAPHLLAVVRDFFDDTYKINSLLYDILEDIKFKQGAHIRVILPESELDKFINNDRTFNQESYLDAKTILTRQSFANLGLVRPKPKLGKNKNTFEALFIDTTENQPLTITFGGDKTDYKIEIVDNPELLKLPKIVDKVRDYRSKATLETYYSTEGREKRLNRVSKLLKKEKNIHEVQKIINDQRSVTPELEVSLTGMDENNESIGHPMDYVLPIEACIPVFVVDPKAHVGYYIPIDQNGYPVKATGNGIDIYRQLKQQITGAIDTAGKGTNSFIQEITGGQGIVGQMSGSVEDLRRIIDSFSSKLEEELIGKLTVEGTEEIQLSKNNSLYQIMLSRMLAKKQTRLLYLPAHCVCYMAFDHDHFGVGRSVLDDVRVLASIRAIMLVGNARASVLNATSRTKYDVKLDPNDANYKDTMALVRESIMLSRSTDMPLGETDISIINKVLQNAGVDIVWSGHEAIPDMSIDASDNTRSRNMVDLESEQNIRNKILMKIGLSPEVVDISRGPQFATSLINESLMMAKRVLQDQVKLEPHVNKWIRTFTRYSQTLKQELENALRTHGNATEKRKAESIINTFIESIEVTLPRPNTVTLEQQIEALTRYKSALDEVLEDFINGEMPLGKLEKNVGEKRQEYLEEISKEIRHMLIRDWMIKNNVMPELTNLFDIASEQSVDLGRQSKEHIKALTKLVNRWVKDRLKLDEEREETGADAQTETGGESDSEDQDTPEQDQEGSDDTEGGEETADGGDADDEKDPFDF